MMAERNISKKVNLTSREMLIIGRLSKGETYKEIAEVLKISHRTVGWHICRLYKKTKCHNKAAIADFARQTGLLKEAEAPKIHLQEILKDRPALSNKKVSFFMLVMLLINGVCLVLLIKLFLSFYKV